MKENGWVVDKGRSRTRQERSTIYKHSRNAQVFKPAANQSDSIFVQQLRIIFKNNFLFSSFFFITTQQNQNFNWSSTLQPKTEITCTSTQGYNKNWKTKIYFGKIPKFKRDSLQGDMKMTEYLNKKLLRNTRTIRTISKQGYLAIKDNWYTNGHTKIYEQQKKSNPREKFWYQLMRIPVDAETLKPTCNTRVRNPWPALLLSN